MQIDNLQYYVITDKDFLITLMMLQLLLNMTHLIIFSRAG